jgi:hypothetical protein
VIRRLALLVPLATLLASCADIGPSPSQPIQPSAPAEVTRIDLPEPGQPFDAAAILAAMRDSRRPGGVPDELETDAIASALAEAIWTLDGEPWRTLSAGGSCGPQTCTLEIAGADADVQAEDLWIFEVTPASGTVDLVSAELRSVPPEMVARLDELTRSLFPPIDGDDLDLTSARWLPPPDETQFVLSYRSGDEERSSCGVDVTVDAVAPGIVSDLGLDC